MRRWLAALASFLILTSGTASAIVGLSPFVDSAGAAATEQATVKMPFSGQWANQYGTTPWEHHRGSYDWAMDVYAVDAPVRINITDATGVVDLEVTDVVLDSTCGGTGGTYVVVEVAVDQTAVGRVLFHHLVDVNVAEGDHIAPGKVLGHTVATPGALGGSCWHVSTPMGIHTHMAVANDVGYSCYVRHQVGQTLSQGTAIGRLGHDAAGTPVGSTPRADCGAPPVEHCRGLVATIVGTPGHDQLVGTDGADVIVGLGGRDTIVGGGGDDVICSGSGADTVDAGAGDDYVHGGQTDDSIVGGAGDDVLIGGLQDDDIDGGPGADRVVGRDGDDSLRGGTGIDRLLGYGGDDEIHGQAGADRLLGGSGDDELRGGGGADKLTGREGHDRCLGGGGTDHSHPSCEIVTSSR
ncbi:MAG: hypothetical protein OES57_03690 [Acidimicrobiia bacterium]|nr:hypothetical protein [Acidimicrobiia bacterium]